MEASGAGVKCFPSILLHLGTPKAPPSPIPTGNYNVSPGQLATMTRDHDFNALQNFGGVKGMVEMLKTNPDKGINDDESNIIDRKNVFGSNTYPRKKGRSFWVSVRCLSRYNVDHFNGR